VREGRHHFALLFAVHERVLGESAGRRGGRVEYARLELLKAEGRLIQHDSPGSAC
jgi:hypothetical protein